MNKTINYLKLLHKDLDYAIEEHLPFPAHYKITPGMSEGADVLEVDIFTQGKKGLISHRQIVYWSKIENDKTRALFVNEFLNAFRSKLKKIF